jgi:hypothetical protein
MYEIEEVSILDGCKVKPEKILSFHGGFCERAKKNARVIARGKLELISWIDGKGEYALFLDPLPSHFMTLRRRDDEN